MWLWPKVPHRRVPAREASSQSCVFVNALELLVSLSRRCRRFDGFPVRFDGFSPRQFFTERADLLLRGDLESGYFGFPYMARFCSRWELCPPLVLFSRIQTSSIVTIDRSTACSFELLISVELCGYHKLLLPEPQNAENL